MTDSVVFMSIQFLPKFIEAYRGHTCLWRVKSREYTHRHKKEDAYNDLVELTRSVVPGCSVDFIKKKIDMLRGNFRRESKKVRASLKPGSEYIYKPKLWYYKLLSFLDEEEGKASASDATSVEEFDAGLEAKVVDHLDHEQPSPQEETVNFPSTTTGFSSERTKRPRQQDLPKDTCLEKAISVLEYEEDEYDKFGAYVSAKLRKMDPTQSIYAEHLINQVLFGGVLERLQENSVIRHPSVVDDLHVNV